MPRRIPFPHDYASAQKAVRCIVVCVELNCYEGSQAIDFAIAI